MVWAPMLRQKLHWMVRGAVELDIWDLVSYLVQHSFDENSSQGGRPFQYPSFDGVDRDPEHEYREFLDRCGEPAS